MSTRIPESLRTQIDTTDRGSCRFERTGARSHGQPVYRRGNEYISPDVDRHNGGIWKKATSDAANLRNKTTRDGTFNEDLTEVVGP